MGSIIWGACIQVLIIFWLKGKKKKKKEKALMRDPFASPNPLSKNSQMDVAGLRSAPAETAA